MSCEESCGRPATHDFEGCALCLTCVKSHMEHGHKHVHSEPSDCQAEVDRLDGSGSDYVRCPRYDLIAHKREQIEAGQLDNAATHSALARKLLTLLKAGQLSPQEPRSERGTA